ncbi:MAG: hypothetical protein COA79_01800 [Planctomycetota bacterium]|nr:MAG: hypothetical protein COA79_01800 [Planctomycetota bacterium]
MVKQVFFIFIVCVFNSGLVFCEDEKIGVPDRDDIEYPDDDAPSKEEVQLGKMLYFDTRLSLKKNQSCATCHNPELGFGDGLKFSLGTMGGKVGRNAPHIYNLAWNSLFFWDGRAGSLEEQALGPIQAAGEMNMPLDKVIERLKKVKFYRDGFEKVYKDKKIESKNIGKAIAAFERTIIVDNTPFDKYMKGDKDAMSPSAVNGMKLFKGKANCTKCHSGPNFTDNSFHNIGVKGDDIGRQKLVKDATMKGAFKVPGLRNVLLTAPYMHDGSLSTLEEVIKFYNRGGDNKANLSKEMKPLKLTDKEIMDLVSFLGSLTQQLDIKRPKIPKDD